MAFQRILFKNPEDRVKNETLEAPVFFVDLNLDQVVDALTAAWQEYNLKPFFFTALHDKDAINYRHEIMRDLENNVLFEYIKTFSQRMRTMRGNLAQADKLYYKNQKKRWFLDAVDV